MRFSIFGKLSELSALREIASTFRPDFVRAAGTFAPVT
jgi:hypothetical protein